MRNHPHLYEINTWPWLESLSRRLDRRVTLGTVPEDAWDHLRSSGMDIVYLMGIWRRSLIGRQVARTAAALFPSYEEAVPGWTADDVVGSAYCIAGYEPDDHIGGWDEVDAVRETLHARGMQLIVDFIPNHTGFDHPWIAAHPDRYVNGSREAFQHAGASFRPVDLPDGRVRYIACGRDPYYPPWTDVAQLNYLNPDTRAAVIAELQHVARHADGVRCDMAMLVLSDVFTRTWNGLAAGTRPPTEFWADAVAAVPGFLLLAEVYWDLEWPLQQIGFDFTYDKRLYDRLLSGAPHDVRDHLRADAEYQQRSARFIENHDEARSAVAFGPRADAAAIVMSTLPGLRFYQDGQFEGRRVRAPVQLGVAREEPTDPHASQFYRRLLEIVDAPVFHGGAWTLCDVMPAGGGASDLVAWRWRAGSERRVVIVSLGSTVGQGWVDVGGDLPEGGTLAFDDLLDGRRYERTRADLMASGLFVRLEPGGAHIFAVVGSS
jgi:alpha amylase-like protein